MEVLDEIGVIVDCEQICMLKCRVKKKKKKEKNISLWLQFFVFNQYLEVCHFLSKKQLFGEETKGKNAFFIIFKQKVATIAFISVFGQQFLLILPASSSLFVPPTDT